VEELDGIFHSDDMVVARAVELVDEGVERGGLAGADWASDEDQAVVVAEEALDDGNVFEAKFSGGANDLGDDAVGAFTRLLYDP
jgi:hypothetical protein